MKTQEIELKLSLED